MKELLLISFLGPESSILFYVLLPIIVIIAVISSKNKKIRELEKEISYLKGLMDREE